MARKSLTNIYMSTLCLEIYMLLNSGISVRYGVEMMLDDESDKDGKIILQNLLDNLEGEVPLSEAMRKGKYFPLYMVNMIEIGEKTGRLAETLKALAEHYERQERLAVSIKNATLYPAVMLAMMIAVVLILVVQVLPIFNDVFARMGAQMSPFATRLMEFGAWFRGASVVIAVVFLVLFVVAFLAWVIPVVRGGVAGAASKLWGGKGVFGRIAASRFVSSMSLAMASGIDIEDSVNLAASLNSNPSISRKYENCVALLRDGKSLADALKEARILSARDSRILSLGEKSGMADSAMAEIARRSDTIVQDEISNIVGKIEPTLVIVTSAIVGIILLSVMLPLMGIMTTIG
ncbi:MAG: type II secretion system F family protein [Defluviitaleaceae bacterium]|nr:type II secretion system F family protein [Defluviitaleaceae bacterium]